MPITTVEIRKLWIFMSIWIKIWKFFFLFIKCATKPLQNIFWVHLHDTKNSHKTIAKIIIYDTFTVLLCYYSKIFCLLLLNFYNVQTLWKFLVERKTHVHRTSSISIQIHIFLEFDMLWRLPDDEIYQLHFDLFKRGRFN